MIYVVDDGDDKVYTYNMPDAIDARLESLSLSGIAFGQFSPLRKSYAAILSGSLTETTVQASAVQEEATVTPAPADADANPRTGHQAAVADRQVVTVTVISPDGSRTRVYQVWLRHCLSGLSEVGLSAVTYIGGSLDRPGGLRSRSVRGHALQLHRQQLDQDSSPTIPCSSVSPSASGSRTVWRLARR